MKWVRVLLNLYPAWWRARYGEEFLALLEDAPPHPTDMADIVRGALMARWKTPPPPTALITPGGMIVSGWTRIGSIASVVLAGPAWIFLVSAAVRRMQPTVHQPAHTALLLFRWFLHLPHWATALWGLALPVAALLVALAATQAYLREHPAIADEWRLVRDLMFRRWRLAAALGGVTFSALFLLVAAAHFIAG